MSRWYEMSKSDRSCQKCQKWQLTFKLVAEWLSERAGTGTFIWAIFGAEGDVETDIFGVAGFRSGWIFCEISPEFHLILHENMIEIFWNIAERRIS